MNTHLLDRRNHCAWIIWLDTPCQGRTKLLTQNVEAAKPAGHQVFLGLLAPYLERDCLRSFTPCKSSEPRTMW